MTRRWLGSLLSSLVPLMAAGCGGQVGEENVVCAAIERVPVGADAPTPLGFRVSDVLAAVEGQHTAELAWADDGQTALTLSLTFDGDAAYLDREWIDDQSGNLAELSLVDCRDVLELMMTVELTTADGALAETWSLPVLAEVGDEVTLWSELAEPSGSLVITDYAPAGEHESVRAWIDLAVGPAGMCGSISGQVSQVDGDVASAQHFDIATIGAPAE